MDARQGSEVLQPFRHARQLGAHLADGPSDLAGFELHEFGDAGAQQARGGGEDGEAVRDICFGPCSCVECLQGVLNDLVDCFAGRGVYGCYGGLVGGVGDLNAIGGWGGVGPVYPVGGVGEGGHV